MEFKNKVFVVTGAGAGIGKEITRQLLNFGAKVVAIDINLEALEVLKRESIGYEDNIFVRQIDITNKEQIENLPQEIIKVYNKIDGVFNVAGIIQPFVPLKELNYTQIEKVFNINFYGTLYLCKTLLPYLLNNTTPTCIVNVSSMGGFLPVYGQSVYGASKAAVKLLTEGMYTELKKTNVRVSLVFPGGVATDITKNSNVEIKTPSNTKGIKLLSAPLAAQLILKGVAKEKFRIIIGKDAKIMDILYRLSPKRAIHLILKKMKSIID